MGRIPNPKIIFKSIPKDYPIPGENIVYDNSATIDLETVPIHGGFLARTLYISPEPWSRERLRDSKKWDIVWTTPLPIGQPMVTNGIVKVLRSEDSNYSPGDILYGLIPWQLYIVTPWDGVEATERIPLPDYVMDIDKFILRPSYKLDRFLQIPLATFTGALGAPGQTAYAGLKEFVPDMKQGQVMYVSTAAGAVGLMVVQLAKMAGLKVIASTGTDEKVNYLLKEIKVDCAFNYKTASVNSVLEKEGPLDYYWDNVGGSTLETALEHCKAGAKVLACGYASEYNNQERYGIKNLGWLFKKRIQIYGVFSPELMPKWGAQFMQDIPPLVSSGQIKVNEDVINGLENAPQAFLNLLQGKHFGRVVVAVSKDD